MKITLTKIYEVDSQRLTRTIEVEAADDAPISDAFIESLWKALHEAAPKVEPVQK